MGSQAKKAYKQALKHLASMPASVLSCSESNMCVNVDIASESLEEIEKISTKLIRLNRKALKGVSSITDGGVCKDTAAACQARAKLRAKVIKKAQKKVSREKKVIKEVSKTITRFQSVCESS